MLPIGRRVYIFYMYIYIYLIFSKTFFICLKEHVCHLGIPTCVLSRNRLVYYVNCGCVFLHLLLSAFQFLKQSSRNAHPFPTWQQFFIWFACCLFFWNFSGWLTDSVSLLPYLHVAPQHHRIQAMFKFSTSVFIRILFDVVLSCQFGSNRQRYILIGDTAQAL